MTASFGAWLSCLALLIGVPSQGMSIKDQVRVSVSTDGDVFHERAPVPLDLEIHNLTDEPLRVGFVVKPVFQNWVEVLYRRVPGQFTTLTYPPEWDPDGPGRDHPDMQLFTIDARGTSVAHFSLAADPARNAFMFDSPGDYELKVIAHRSRNGLPSSLETPPLRIHVEPAPPSEAAALEDWGVDLAIFAQNDGGEGGPRFRESLSRALKFMDAHPTSLYSELLRARSLETLELLRREGKEFTELEREGYERLKPKPAQ